MFSAFALRLTILLPCCLQINRILERTSAQTQNAILVKFERKISKREYSIESWKLQRVFYRNAVLDPDIILVVNSDISGTGEFGKESIYLSWLKYYKLL
jgi:hypothetical protein